MHEAASPRQAPATTALTPLCSHVPPDRAHVCARELRGAPGLSLGKSTAAPPWQLRLLQSPEPGNPQSVGMPVPGARSARSKLFP